MVAAPSLLLEQAQDPRTRFRHAYFLLGQVGHVPGETLSRRDLDVLGHLLSMYAKYNGTFAAYRATIAERLRMSVRSVSGAFASLRRVRLEGLPLLETPIVAPLHTEAPWGVEVHANLHGYLVAVEPLIRALEGAERTSFRPRTPTPEVGKGEAVRLLRRRRHGPPAPPLEVTEADPVVAELAAKWDALGLRNADGTPSRCGVPERRTLAKRLRERWSADELEHVILGAGASPQLRSSARVPFALAFGRPKTTQGLASLGRAVQARGVAAGKDARTSLQDPASTLDPGSVCETHSPLSPLSQSLEGAPLARSGGTAPAAPGSHVEPAPPARRSPSGTPPPSRGERTTNEGEHAPYQRRRVVVHIAALPPADWLDRIGNVVPIGRARGAPPATSPPRRETLEERLRLVCPGCGLRSIGPDGRCSSCGARKGPS